MAAAAATAVIAPVALLAAPAAYAEGPSDASPSATASESSTPTGDPSTSPAPSGSAGDSTSTPSQSPSSPAPSTSAPSASASETAPEPSGSATPTTPAPTTSAPEESESPDVPECKDSKVDVDIKGLPGKIAAGSGWHKFSLNVVNNSDATLRDLSYLAGASSDKDGEDLFTTDRVQLQAWDPEAEVWQDLNVVGYAIGYVGHTPELEAGYEVDIPLRINVTSKAPVGAGFSLGATIYGDSDGACTGYGDVSYEFQIVAAGTDTEGTRPAEGGRAPVADSKTKPAVTTSPQVTGTLAATGSSSALPVIGLVGGVAVVAGAGAVFAVRRRKAGAGA
nr:LPXTG cell wall anchor domain-containing protein [Streptomyces harenosi]